MDRILRKKEENSAGLSAYMSGSLDVNIPETTGKKL
jgi:hypothetical protein